MFSTGTEFNMALAEATQKKNPQYRRDIEEIKEFIDTSTGFHAVSVSVKQESELVIKAIAK